MDKTKLIVLIPSYQPDETLVYLSRGLKEEGFKVLIVDDGSGPSYDEIFKQSEEYATVLRYEHNHGKGYALRFGFKYIKENLGDYIGVITADGDGQHRILDIIAVGEKLLKKDKAILGVRSFDVKVPIKSKIGNNMSKFTQSLVTHKYLSDNQCGLRAFPVRDLDFYLSISGDRYEYEMKVISSMQLRSIPYETQEIETIYENNNSKTHFRPLFDTFLIQRSILGSSIFNIIFYILEAAFASLFYYLVAPLTPFPNIGLEVSIFTGFLLAYLLKGIFTLIIYHPIRYKARLFKEFIYQTLLFVALTISSLLFTRILSLPLPITYLITGFIILVPLYYFTKGVGVFLEAQRGWFNYL